MPRGRPWGPGPPLFGIVPPFFSQKKCTTLITGKEGFETGINSIFQKFRSPVIWKLVSVNPFEFKKKKKNPCSLRLPTSTWKIPSPLNAKKAKISSWCQKSALESPLRAFSARIHKGIRGRSPSSQAVSGTSCTVLEGVFVGICVDVIVPKMCAPPP